MAKDNLDARAREIVRIAEECGVRDNPFFEDTLKIYESQRQKLEALDKSIAESGMLVTKEYVKGRENLYMHPAIKELPKQIDVANKTVDKLLDIIERLGKKNTTGDDLLDYIRK